MKKLKLQVQISVDGYVTGSNGEMDWLVWDWDDALKQYVDNLTKSVDTILLGRKMVGGFVSHWGDVANDTNNPEHETGKTFIDMPKVVFTNTLTETDWINTTLATGDLTSEMEKLKNGSGKDMIVYGGASFVSSLVNKNLIDEYHLFVNPAILGQGKTIFGEINHRQNLQLVNSIRFDCNIVLLHYLPIST